MAKPCCERSEPTSAEGAASEGAASEGAASEGVGSGFPTKIGCK